MVRRLRNLHGIYPAVDQWAGIRWPQRRGRFGDQGLLQIPTLVAAVTREHVVVHLTCIVDLTCEVQTFSTCRLKQVAVKFRLCPSPLRLFKSMHLK